MSAAVSRRSVSGTDAGAASVTPSYHVETPPPAGVMHSR